MIKKLINWISKNNQFFYWCILIIYSVFHIYYRPIHQDDGWYAANAYNLANNFFCDNCFSSWDFSVPFVDEVGVGFIYSLLQLVYILIFGSGVFYTKVLIFSIVMLLMILLDRIAASYHTSIRVSSLLLPTLVLFNPIVIYHFYNRPELLAVILGLLVFYIIINSDRLSGNWHKLVYLIPWLMLDIHPISIFFVSGVILWSIIKKRISVHNIIIGIFSGAVIYLFGNFIFNGSLGLFSPLIGLYPFKGDHYVPIIESDTKDILRIFIIRYNIPLKIFAVSLLPIFIYHFKIFKHLIFRLTQSIFFFSFVVFVVTTSLFSEAIGNGYPLYLYILLSLMIYFFLLDFIISSRINRIWYYVPYFILMCYLNYLNVEVYLNRIKYLSTFDTGYNKLVEFIPKNSKISMRPTFSFSLSNLNLKAEYFYYILFYMKLKNISFKRALFEKKYDFIAIDEMDNKSMFGELPTYWNNVNPFYRKLPRFGIPIHEIELLKRQGILSQIYEFKEISHGNTIFYKVDQVKLESQFK